MKIAIDARPALWPTTGIGTIVRNVITRIQAIDRLNEFVFYFDREPPAELVGPAAFHAQPGKLRWANGYLRGELRERKFDVFLSFLEKEIPLWTGRTKLVCMVHDLIPLRFPETVFRNRFHRTYYMALLRAATSQAAIVLTNSEHSRREIIETLHVPERKIRKITLGVDEVRDRADGSDEAVLARLGLTGPYLLAMGSSEPRKNNARVIEAFAGLGASEALQLAVAGGPWRGQVFPAHTLRPSVVTTGYLAEEELDCLLRNAVALVFASLHEGFGLPVLEAMARGVPVITSNRTALPEVGGDAAIYVNPESVGEIRVAMERVIGDPRLRADLARRGEERASHFRWDRTCQELKAIFAELS